MIEWLATLGGLVVSTWALLYCRVLNSRSKDRYLRRTRK